MNIKKNINFTLLVCMSFLTARSQDIHFTQFSENPMLINPSFTGMYKGDFRASSNYKNQWANIGSVYETYSASADFKVLRNSIGLKSTAIGISAFQDVAGSSRTKTSRLDLNISQTVYITDNADITLGIGFMYMDLSANFSGLSWGSQYNGTAYDERINSREGITGYSEKAFDLSTGFLFRIFDYNEHPLELGFSAFHLARPRLTYLRQDERLPVRFTYSASKEFDVEFSDIWGYKILAFSSFQKKAREIIIGGLVRRKLSLVSKYTGYYKNVDFYGGLYFRIGDAVIPVVKVNFYEKLSVGMSYDFNISKLSTASAFRGGPEFSISYTGSFFPTNIVSPKSVD